MGNGGGFVLLRFSEFCVSFLKESMLFLRSDYAMDGASRCISTGQVYCFLALLQDFDLSILLEPTIVITIESTISDSAVIC
jgi:hypothetical protein